MMHISERWDIAFAHPLTGWIVVFVAIALAAGALIIGLLQIAGRLSPETRRELWLRLGSWSCSWRPSRWPEASACSTTSGE